MSKRFLTGLVMIAVAVLVLLISGNSRITLDFLITDAHPQQSIALFIFLAYGVVVGFLLR